MVAPREVSAIDSIRLMPKLVGTTCKWINLQCETVQYVIGVVTQRSGEVGMKGRSEDQHEQVNSDACRDPSLMDICCGQG